MTTKRTASLTMRLTPEEQEMARRLSAAEDDPISRILRRYLRERYRARFGDELAKDGAR